MLTPASKFIFDNQGQQVLMQFEGEFMTFLKICIVLNAIHIKMQARRAEVYFAICLSDFMLNYRMYKYTGAAVNFQGQWPNPLKTAHFHFLVEIGPLNTVLQIHKWRIYCGRLTYIKWALWLFC